MSGTNNELTAIAAAWIAQQHASEGTKEYEDTFWAFQKMVDLCMDDPMIAWRVILEIATADQSDVVTENLAAGPLESLLSDHGESFIAIVEDEARRNPVVSDLLGGVWKGRMSAEVWARVCAIADGTCWN